ncbi:MAG TPA: hypothetical protein VJC10_03040 [Patescibacteria group bacterium]|nr:hypothetical protein [Patescibacteria group bacterium]
MSGEIPSINPNVPEEQPKSLLRGSQRIIIPGRRGIIEVNADVTTEAELQQIIRIGIDAIDSTLEELRDELGSSGSLLPTKPE